MTPTLVLNVVGLTSGLIGPATPGSPRSPEKALSAAFARSRLR
ncbi:MAG TPA: hypothetical protein PKD49_08245 [Hyphomicrobium sp.]|nr:hypothetical protein [Hyphomicrobium sp.]